MKKKKEEAVEVKPTVETSEDVSLSVEEKRNATIVEADEAEKAISEKKEKKKKNIFGELFRFVVVGVICTLVDFGCQFGMLKVFENNLSTIDAWGSYVAFAIAILVAFIISTVVNFLFSRLWVFQNVDKNINTKSAKSFWTYVGLGAGGFFLGIALQEAGVFICDISMGVKIAYDITKVSWADLFNEGGMVFWAFVIIFCVKTLVTMIYNYLTRKLIIFKSPRPVVETAPEPEPVVEEPKEERPQLVTAASFRRMFNEELEARFGKGQQKMNRAKAWKMVNDEISKREESGK
ncbi:MAG: GtrA family protein [Bacilli bacterium]|nr:GtrA family protein [Bacilli bacterium]